MKTTARIIQIMPIERPFRPGDIADIVYPDLIRSDSEGRVFNRGVATITRLLRGIRGIQEKPGGIFYAHEEFFEGDD